jgi:hypothetical protein
LKHLNTQIACYLSATLWLLASVSVQALETDQFYAWGKPIEDSTHYLNAWVRLQIQDVLDTRVNGKRRDCQAVINLVQKRLQNSIYQPIELWINSTDLVDRVPRGIEEYRDYRKSYLLSKTVPLDTARGLLPSPTIAVGRIRIGSDKLAHFFSEGWWYYQWWQKHQDKFSGDELQRKLLQYGVELEWWVQGKLLTGVISAADMEANYQGFIFYRQLCGGDEPLLYMQDGGWHFSAAFDISSYVSPEWDESWNANIYSKLRWKGIRETMAGYCPMLQGEWVQQQRAYYAELDTQTPTEDLLDELSTAGELPDRGPFDITSVCDGPN